MGKAMNGSWGKTLAFGLALLPSMLGVFPSVAHAQKSMDLTYYDDGLACPANCDAHVVFSSDHNGTKNAFAPPMSNRVRPSAHRCQEGASCVICFGAPDATCLETTYRGNGPPVGRFDVTPAFLAAHCGKANLPEPVSQLCKSLKRAAKPYISKMNCIHQMDSPSCQQAIAEAQAAQQADVPEYKLCMKLGVVAYNKQQKDALKHRALKAGCGYAENLKETNRKRTYTWHRLMPGACRPDTFVGKWGTDCCTGLALTDASFGGGECGAFYR